MNVLENAQIFIYVGEPSDKVRYAKKSKLETKVQSMMENLRKKLQKIEENGPLDLNVFFSFSHN